MDLCTTAEEAGGKWNHMRCQDSKIWKASQHASQFQFTLSNQVSAAFQACPQDLVFAMDWDMGYADSHFPPPQHATPPSQPSNRWQRTPQGTSTILPPPPPPPPRTQKPSKLQQQLAMALAWNRDSSTPPLDANTKEQSQHPSASNTVTHCKDLPNRSLACARILPPPAPPQSQPEQPSTRPDNPTPTHDLSQGEILNHSSSSITVLSQGEILDHSSLLEHHSAVLASSAQRFSTRETESVCHNERSEVMTLSKQPFHRHQATDTLSSHSQHSVPPQLAVFHLPSPSDSLPAYDHDNTPGPSPADPAQHPAPAPPPTSSPPSAITALPAPAQTSSESTIANTPHTNSTSRPVATSADTYVCFEGCTVQPTAAPQHPPPASAICDYPQQCPPAAPQPAPEPPFPIHYGFKLAGLSASSPSPPVNPARHPCGHHPSAAGAERKGKGSLRTASPSPRITAATYPCSGWSAATVERKGNDNLRTASPSPPLTAAAAAHPCGPSPGITAAADACSSRLSAAAVERQGNSHLRTASTSPRITAAAAAHPCGRGPSAPGSAGKGKGGLRGVLRVRARQSSAGSTRRCDWEAVEAQVTQPQCQTVRPWTINACIPVPAAHSYPSEACGRNTHLLSA